MELWKYKDTDKYTTEEIREAIDFAINAINIVKMQNIDKLAMLTDIYMEGVNMTGEFQGCWVRFKNIEKIVDNYIVEPNKCIYKEREDN